MKISQQKINVFSQGDNGLEELTSISMPLEKASSTFLERVLIEHLHKGDHDFISETFSSKSLSLSEAEIIRHILRNIPPVSSYQTLNELMGGDITNEDELRIAAIGKISQECPGVIIRVIDVSELAGEMRVRFFKDGFYQEEKIFLDFNTRFDPKKIEKPTKINKFDGLKDAITSNK